jgi:DNA-binding CsgD family transcriptional regulator
MRALLEDAIGCLAGAVGQQNEREALALDARQWVEARDRRWPFSFENVCEALDFDAESLRRRLLRDHAAPVARTRTPIPCMRPAAETSPAEHEVIRMIKCGEPLRAVAERFGISISKVSVLSCGLASRMKAERDREIRELRAAGLTYRQLASRFGLSRIRVMRICTRPIDTPADAGRPAA